MLITILTLFVVALVLSGVLWAGSLWLQGMLYETPGGELYWRAPAVGVGLTLFYGLWVAVNSSTGGACGTFYKMRTTSLKQYDELKAVTRKNGPEDTYRRRQHATDNGSDYVLVGPDGQTVPTKLTETPERIIIEDGGTKMVFEPQRDAKGNFKREQGQNLQYYDKSGRTIEEGNPGQVQQFHGDWLAYNAVFNILHFVLWFVGLWLLLRFQWVHALGLAVALWATMTLVVLPMLLG